MLGFRGLDLLCRTLLAVAAESVCGPLLWQLTEGQTTDGRTDMLLLLHAALPDKLSQGSTRKEEAEFEGRG